MRYDSDVKPPWYQERLEVPRPLAVDRLVWRSEAYAITVGGVHVFSDMFDFTVSTFVRAPDQSDDRLGTHSMRRRPMEEVTPDFLRIGLQYADGRTATNLTWTYPDDADPATTLVLKAQGGGGSPWQFTQEFRVWPLPPPGRVTFVFEWPAAGLSETHVNLDGEAFIDAAAAAEPIWPSDPAAPSGSPSRVRMS